LITADTSTLDAMSQVVAAGVSVNIFSEGCAMHNTTIAFIENNPASAVNVTGLISEVNRLKPEDVMFGMAFAALLSFTRELYSPELIPQYLLLGAQSVAGANLIRYVKGDDVADELLPYLPDTVLDVWKHSFSAADDYLFGGA